MSSAGLRVLEGHLRTYRHTWKGTVVTSFLNPVLFLTAMGLGLGALVDRGAGVGLGDISYLAFLAPGLLAASAMQTAATESSWPVMAGIKWQRTYHAALATPVRPRDLVYGHLAWVTARVGLAALVFAVVMVAFGVTGPVRAAVAVAAGIPTGMAFSPAITAYAASLDSDYGLSSLFRFGIVPMFLFSGTFFPVSRLPDWLEPLAVLTPLWHGVQLTRAAAVGVGPAWHPLAHLTVLLACAVAGTLAAIRAYERRLVL